MIFQELIASSVSGWYVFNQTCTIAQLLQLSCNRYRGTARAAVATTSVQRGAMLIRTNGLHYISHTLADPVK